MNRTIISLLACVLTASGATPDRTYRKLTEDVSLGSSYTNDMRVRRWPDSPSISCMNPPKGYEAVFDAAVKQINDALTPSRFEVRPLLPNEPTAQIKFYFTTRTDYIRVMRENELKPGDRGFDWRNWWDANSQITKSVGIVTTDGITADQLTYNTLRTILGTLGFAGWASDQQDTIFYYTSLKPRKDLSPSDRRLIPFFYMHLKPNFERFQVRRAYDTYWSQWRQP